MEYAGGLPVCPLHHLSREATGKPVLLVQEERKAQAARSVVFLLQKLMWPGALGPCKSWFQF